MSDHRHPLPAAALAALVALAGCVADTRHLSQLETAQTHALVGQADLSNLSARQVAQIRSALVQRTDRTDKQTQILMALRPQPHPGS